MTALSHGTYPTDETSVYSDTLEIFVFDCVRVNRAPRVFPLPLPEIPMPEPGFARILEPIKALVFAPRPPPVMGAFVINPKPMFL